MNCPQCQTPIEDTANFCHECGTKARFTAPPAVASAPGEDEQQAGQLITQARDLLAQNDADGALYAAQAAIALTPDAVAPHLVLGEVFQHQGRLSEAAAQFEVTLRLDPSNLAAAQRLDAVRAQPVSAAAGAESKRVWGMVGMAAAGVAVLAGGFAMISSAGKSDQPSRNHAATPIRVGAPLSPTRLPTGINTPAPSGNATLKPASAPVSAPSAPIRTTNTPTTTLSRARPAVPGYTAGTPAIRVGLPPVANTPSTTANVPTIGPAVPRTLMPAPVSAANVGAPGGERPQDPRIVAPAPQPGVAGQPGGFTPQAAAPDQRPGKKSRNGEPLEPDTGFIRIEPANRGAAPADGVPPRTGANPEGTGITIPLNRR